MDIYKTLADIKEGQEKVQVLLNDLIRGKSQKKIYDIVDLTQLLHVSRRKVFDWIKEGILPHSKVGGKVFITDEDLELFLENHGENRHKLQGTIKSKIK